MSEDRRVTRMQVSAEEARKTRAARIEQEHQREQLALQRERKKLLLDEERQQARENARSNRVMKRQQARQKLARRVQILGPTVGRRVMIVGPILAPMTVAWIGQIGFARDTLKWPLLGGLVFAAAWELTTAFSGWMYHQARKDGDRGALFRVATWVFATAAGGMNYWHACPTVGEWDGRAIRTVIDLDPSPKAVSYGAMSLVGIALWELYSSLIHRRHLRGRGIVASARPRFGLLRWLRFTRITWHAWSLSVRYGITTIDAAWSKAVAEVERRDREKDRRPEVRVTVVRVVTRTVPSTTTLSVCPVERPATTRPASSGRISASASTPVDATTTAATGGHVHHENHSGMSSGDRVHRVDATTSQMDATRHHDHQHDRLRPQPKTTTKTGRDHVDARPKPTDEDKEHAIALYLQSVQDGKPLSKRDLAKELGFSPSWALKCIQEAGLRPVGGGHADDHVDASTPKVQTATGEVKTG